MKCERLALAKSLCSKDSNGLKENLKEIEKNFDKIKQNVVDAFSQIREIIEYKEKEIILQIDYMSQRRKIMMEKELENIVNNISSIENLIKIINFGVSLYSPSIIDGISHPILISIAN